MLIWCSNRQVLRHIFHLDHHQKSIIFDPVQRINFLIKFKSIGFIPRIIPRGFLLNQIFNSLFFRLTIIKKTVPIITDNIAQ